MSTFSLPDAQKKFCLLSFFTSEVITEEKRQEPRRSCPLWKSPDKSDNPALRRYLFDTPFYSQYDYLQTYYIINPFARTVCFGINFYMITFQADQDQILFLIGTVAPP